MKILIFKTSEDAEAMQEKIHNFLVRNRKDYNAERWCNLYKHETRDLWMVKVPSDAKKFKDKLNYSNILDRYDAIVEKLPDNWENKTQIIN